MFDGSKFTLQKEYDISCNINNIIFEYNIVGTDKTELYTNTKVVYIGENTKTKVMDNNSIFSNIAGNGSNAGDFEYTKLPFGVKTDADGT
jgi:hypothetical protein